MKLAMQQVPQALSGPRCISLVGCLIAAVSSFLATLATESATQDHFGEALLRSTSVLLFTGAALYLANLVVRQKKKTYQANPYLVLGFFVAIGALRPLVSALIGVLFGVEFAIDLPRVGMALFTTVTSLTILAVALNALDQSAETIMRLQHRSDELLGLRKERRQRIGFIRASLATSVIEPVIDRLVQIRQELLGFGGGRRPVNELDQLAAQVRDLSGNTARRAAHEVASSNPGVVGYGDDSLMVPEGRWSAFKDAVLVSPYYPKIMAAVVLVGFLFGSIRIYGVLGVAVSVLLSIVTGLAFKLSELIYRGRNIQLQSDGVKCVFALVGFVVVSALATSFVTVLALVFGGADSVRVSTAWATFFTVLTMSVLISAAFSAIKSRQITITSLEEMTAELEHEVGNQQVVLDRLHQTIARQLHGDVQSRLSAIALRLDWIGGLLSSSPPVDPRSIDAEINLVGDELDRLTVQLDNLELSNSYEKVDYVIDELRGSWGQVLQLDFAIDYAIIERINQSGPACRTVTEMMREGITNAVKHGGAQKVRIHFQADESDWIVLSVADDGQGLNLSSTHGFGLASLASDVVDLEIIDDDGGGAILTGRVLVPHIVTVSS